MFIQDLRAMNQIVKNIRLAVPNPYTLLTTLLVLLIFSLTPKKVSSSILLESRVPRTICL